MSSEFFLRFVIVGVLGGAFCCAQDQTEKSEAAKWIVKRDGWQIPGRDKFETMAPGRRWNTIIDGKTVEVSMWGPELIRKQQGDCNAAPIPRFALWLHRRLEYDEVWAAAYRVLRFDYQNQAFLYDVEAEPCTKNSHVALLEMLAFYDDDGDGCFEMLEFKDTRLPPVEPWRPRLAKWVVDPAAKNAIRCRPVKGKTAPTR